MSIMSRPSYWSTVTLYVVYFGALVSTYARQIAPTNAYAGMHEWSISPFGWAIVVVTLLVIPAFVHRLKGDATDYFVVFYSSIPVMSFVALHSASGTLNDRGLLVATIALLAPLFALNLLVRWAPLIRIRGILSPLEINTLIFFMLALVMLGAYMTHPPSAGFGLSDSHLRRFEGREIYSAGSVLAYGLGMSMNGLVPYLAFRAGLSRNYIFLMAALLCAVFFFWLVGVKSVFLYVIAAFMMGLVVTHRDGPVRVPRYFLLSVVGLWLIVLCEWLFFNGYSVVVDYLFRRVFAVQAEVQGFYFYFLSDWKELEWDWWIGAKDADFQATYHIGEKYLKVQGSNANTNTFLHELISNGLLGYACSIVVVSVVFVIFDRFWQYTRNPSYLFLGFMYGMLIVEQNYTIALVSSGTVLLFILTVLEKNEMSRGTVKCASEQFS